MRTRLEICHYLIVAHSLGSTFLIGVSLATITAISVDRLLVLLFGLAFRKVVTLKLTNVTKIELWPYSSGNTALWFYRRSAWRIFSSANIYYCVYV